MIYIRQVFDSGETEAREYRERYLASYHPWGYGAHITIEPPDPKRARDPDKWVANGYRAESCE
jgi:hypothetical protein